MSTATLLKWEEKQPKIKIEVIIVPPLIQASISSSYKKKYNFVLVTTDIKNCCYSLEIHAEVLFYNPMLSCYRGHSGNERLKQE